MEILVILIVIAIALGTLLLLLGFGALFLGSFTKNKKFALVKLLLLGFSAVIFVVLGKPWYYSLPLWLIPILEAHITLPPSPLKKRAIIVFWLGLGLFSISAGTIFYTVVGNVNIPETLQKIKDKEVKKQQVLKVRSKVEEGVSAPFYQKNQ
ncbi:MAG: hypothetical protein ACWIPH_05400 [Ostreibacterium sp.]